MALRFDPEASARMAAALAGDNHVALTNALGRKPDASELYLAHFLGSDGAARCWGGNAFGQVGAGDEVNHGVPVPVLGL